MRAKIFQPARSSMSSGMAGSRKWVLEYSQDAAREIDPLMGWTSSDDTQSQVRLKFDTREEAMEYALSKGFDVTVGEPHPRRVNVRPGGYGDNFATYRRSVWTH